jgi:hypothetical protein
LVHTALEPGGTTTVVPCCGGGGLLLLKLKQPPNASVSKRASVVRIMQRPFQMERSNTAAMLGVIRTSGDSKCRVTQ